MDEENPSKKYCYSVISAIDNCIQYHNGHYSTLVWRVKTHLRDFSDEMSSEDVLEIRLALEEAVEGFEERRANEVYKKDTNFYILCGFWITFVYWLFIVLTS